MHKMCSAPGFSKFNKTAVGAYGVAEVTVKIRKKVHREIANLKDSMMIAIMVPVNECEKYYGREA